MRRLCIGQSGFGYRSCWSFFLGTDVYPFRKIFYTGVHFEFDLNIFDKNAMNALGGVKEKVTRSFPGFRSYAVAGLDIPLSRRVSLLLSGMPGWQFYIISDNWEVSSGGTSVNITTQNGTTYKPFCLSVQCRFFNSTLETVRSESDPAGTSTCA